MVLLFTVMCVCGVSRHNASAVTLDFENVPINYNYYWNSATNLDGFYPGLSFGPGATILDSRYGWPNAGMFPPHSGTAVLFTSYSNIDVIFDNPVSDFSIWYTGFQAGVYVDAYSDSAMNTLLGSVSGGKNPYANSELSLDFPNIMAVKIREDSPSWTTLDDITFTTTLDSVVPEPATLSLLGLGALGLFFRRKKIA